MKNFLAILLLIITIFYTIFCFVENVKLKKEVALISAKVEHNTETEPETEIETEVATVKTDYLKQQKELKEFLIEKTECEFFGVSMDEDYELNKKAINALKNTIGDNFDIRTNDEKKIALMKDMFNVIFLDKKKTRRNFNSDKQYQNELIQRISEKGLKFIGDSQVNVFKSYAREIDSKLNCFHTFRGQNIYSEYVDIDKFLTPDIKNIVFFNGCNIAPFSTGEEYVKAYKELINKVKLYNPEIKIFISSLLPATQETIKKNIAEGDKNKYYNTPMLDEALRKEFYFNNKDAMYIETKWIPEDYIYNEDGLHFRQGFYYSYLPYVLDFIEFFS